MLTINTSNAAWLLDQGYQLKCSSKWSNSRSLRRFLVGTSLPPDEVLQSNPQLVRLVWARDQGLTEAQFVALVDYAKKSAEIAAQWMPEAEGLRCIGHESVASGTLYTEYAFEWNPAHASLRQLQAMVESLMNVIDGMIPFTRDQNSTAFVDCPLYQYRNLPCSIAPDEELWCISGTDKHYGGGGVLEWCYDEEDATSIMGEMSRFPNRFPGLMMAPFVQQAA